VFSVPYSTGTIKAVGVDNDREIESTILKTSNEAAKIEITADRNEIVADGQDLSFVTVEITDENGVHQPNAENALQFEITGPGKIIGITNANLKDSDQHSGNACKTWKGRALVVVRSAYGGGEIRLKVTSHDLTDATLQINSIAQKIAN
jgi:beta-galactosidase